MPVDYEVLAPVYGVIGMDRFAEMMTPRLIDYAQRNDWMGRRILDLGCGTGVTLEWLTRHSYVVVGVDQSPDMLGICRQRMDSAGLNHDVRQHDLRESGVDVGRVDMALALDVMNELNSLRELETVFKHVYDCVGDGRLFVFDLHTVQGLAAQSRIGDELVYNDADLTVMVHNHFDYERQLFERHFIVFQRGQAGWQRREGKRILRGYPAQVVATLLQRCGFTIKHVINTQFEDFEPATMEADRIVFLAERE